MKELGRGNKRLQHNIVDLYPGLPTQTDEAFKVDGRKHTHTHTRKSVANKFQLGRMNKQLALTDVLSMTNKVPLKLVNLSISSRSHPEKLPITNAWVVHDLKFSTSWERASSAKESFDYLNDIPFEPAESEKIELLIGADQPNLHLYTETKSINNNEPFA